MTQARHAGRRKDLHAAVGGGRWLTRRQLVLVAALLFVGASPPVRPQVTAVGATPPPQVEGVTSVGTLGAGDVVRPPQEPPDEDDQRVLHVAPPGSDRGSGSAEDPFGSLQHALQQMRPGWTLVVMDGVYREDLSDLDLARGKPNRPIRVRAAEGANPTLVGLLWLEDADHWYISGLDVTWNPANEPDDHMVKFQGGDGWVLEDAELSHARSYAALLIAGDARRFRLSRLHVHDTHRSNDTNQDHLIYVNADTDGGVIEHCLLVGSENGRGIKVGPAKPTDDPVGELEIRYNTFYDNRGPSNLQLSYSARKVVIHRNIFARSGTESTSVTAYRLDGEDSVAYDNIATGSDGVLPGKGGGIRDLGGNRMLDPQFRDPDGGDFRPQAPEAQGYGAFATPATDD